MHSPMQQVLEWFDLASKVQQAPQEEATSRIISADLMILVPITEWSFWTEQKGCQVDVFGAVWYVAEVDWVQEPITGAAVEVTLVLTGDPDV